MYRYPWHNAHCHIRWCCSEEVEEEEHEEEHQSTAATSAQTSHSAKTVQEKVPPPLPFKVGNGLPVIPPKPVAKIQKGEYVDMTELLKDNLEADRRRSAQDGGVAAAVLVCSAWMSGEPVERERSQTS